MNIQYFKNMNLIKKLLLQSSMKYYYDYLKDNDLKLNIMIMKKTKIN